MSGESKKATTPEKNLIFFFNVFFKTKSLKKHDQGKCRSVCGAMVALFAKLTRLNRQKRHILFCLISHASWAFKKIIMARISYMTVETRI